MELIVRMGGAEVARIPVPPRGLERCRVAAIAAADAAPTREHPARVFKLEALSDIGPMAGDSLLIYETPLVV